MTQIIESYVLSREEINQYNEGLGEKNKRTVTGPGLLFLTADGKKYIFPEILSSGTWLHELIEVKNERLV